VAEPGRVLLSSVVAGVGRTGHCGVLYCSYSGTLYRPTVAGVVIVLPQGSVAARAIFAACCVQVDL